MNSPSITAAAGTSTAGGSEEQHSLWLLHGAASTSDTFYQTWLALQCSMVEGATQGVLVLGPPETGPFVPVSLWPKGEDPGAFLADVAGRTLEARQAQIVQAAPAAVVSCPIVM